LLVLFNTRPHSSFVNQTTSFRSFCSAPINSSVPLLMRNFFSRSRSAASNQI
jgi:hypothetical protein